MYDLPEKRWPFSYIFWKSWRFVAIRPKVHTQGRRRRRSSARAVIHRCPPLRHSTQLFSAACHSEKERKNYTTKNNNTIKNSQRSAAAAATAQERQKIRNKSIICVRYYYAWKWGRLLLLSGWQKNNWQPQRNAHTHRQGGKWSSPGALYSCPILEGGNITKVSVQSGFFLFFHFVKILVCAFVLSLFTFFLSFFF